MNRSALGRGSLVADRRLGCRPSPHRVRVRTGFESAPGSSLHRGRVCTGGLPLLEPYGFAATGPGDIHGDHAGATIDCNVEDFDIASY
ncbi:MAG: hypothetical protein ACK4UY_08605 [Dietzia sp.]